MSDEKTDGFVPVPNLLFDEVLPILTDTALRVLLVVIRSTRGFREKDEFGRTRYKQRDWLSHRQLIARTGRSSGTISAAIQELVFANLVVVENAWGVELRTAEDRRRNLGPLYFRLGEKWKTTRIPRIEKRQTTTHRGNYKKRRVYYRSLSTAPRLAGPEHISSVLDRVETKRAEERR